MKKILSIFLLSLLFPSQSFPLDQNKIDSLENELKKFELIKKNFGNKIDVMYDTVKATILNNICEEYWMNSPEKGMDVSLQLLHLSQQIGFSKGMANAYNSIGIIYFYMGDYSHALENNKKALKVSEKIGDRNGIAFSQLCIGNIYRIEGNPEALKNYFSALKLFDETGNKKYIASCYNNIGIIYDNQRNYSEALKNYLSTLKIMQEIGYKDGIAVAYGNIAVIYQEEGNYSAALKNNFACLTICEETGNKSSAALSLGNIGSIYDDKGNYPEALKNEFASLKITESIKDKSGIAHNYMNIGTTYLKQKKNKDALLYLNKGLSIANEIGDQEDIKESYHSLATLDSMQGNYKQSLEHYKLFIALRDSIESNENTKKITQQQMQYDFDKKEVLTKADQEKKDALVLKEIQKQKLIRNGSIFGFALVLMLVGVTYNRYRLKQKSNAALSKTLMELRETQTQLVQSEKMAAFGIVASRVSHEIQNPLNFVNNFSELSKEMVDDVIHSDNTEDRKQHAKLLIANLEKINEHGKRAAMIVKQLQDHTNKGTAHEFFEKENE